MPKNVIYPQLVIGEGRPIPVVQLNGREAISELFCFDIDVAAHGWTPVQIEPGDQATLGFQSDTAMLRGQRTINGVVDEVSRHFPPRESGATHRIRLLPTVSRGLRVQAQQAFLGMNVPSIIETKLARLRVPQFDMVDGSRYPKRDFVVQLGETDWAFIKRLVEHLGISFYFDHFGANHTLVFADSNDDFKAAGNASHITLSDRADTPDALYRLDVSDHAVPSNFIVHDHNYRRPDLSVVGEYEVPGVFGGGVVEYGVHMKDEAEAQWLATVRAEEHLCRRRRYTGESSIVNLIPGGKTVLGAMQGTVGEEPRTELLITSVDHHFAGGMGEGEEGVYRNTFEAVDTKHTFRPRRVTPRPKVAGFMTGVIQGAPGAAENDRNAPALDDKGRYWVEFHFDTILGDPSQPRSHRIRMAQAFAGAGFGMHFPLHPGTEVAVGFANGDPDRPVILGAVPNEHTSSPVTGANANESAIRTASGALFEFSERK